MKKVNKKVINIILIIVCTIICISIFAPNVFALTGFYNNDFSVDSNNPFVKFTNSTIGTILYIVMKIAQYASVAVLLIIGITYFTGSVEDKAASKKKLIIYVISFIVIFCASSITSYIFKLVGGN